MRMLLLTALQMGEVHGRFHGSLGLWKTKACTFE